MAKVNFDELSVHASAKDSPGFLLWRASTKWRRLVEASLKPIGLTHPQFVILTSVAWLTRSGDQTTQVAVGRHAELDPNTTSQVLRGLEAKGLIERVPGADERSKSPILSDRGAELLQEALPVVEGVDGDFFADIDLEKCSAIKVLQKLAGF